MGNAADQQFTAIVGPHFDALYRAALRLTRRRHDAEDLVQEVCLRAYSRLAEVANLRHARSWLLRVQYRVFVDANRRERRSPFRTPPSNGEQGTSAAGDEPSIEDLTDALTSQRELHWAWDQLERDQRALLALHAEGYSLGELEVICGISKNAVGARLHRARARLAKLLKQESGTCVRLPQTET